MNVKTITLAAVITLLSAGALFAGQTQYEYDEFNRLKKTTYSNGDTIDYTYDELGNVTSMITNVPILTIIKSGSGTVTSSDGYISCGSSCTKNYRGLPTSVTLTATPADATAIVSSWTYGDGTPVSGTGCYDGNNTCVITMNGQKDVIVSFSRPTLALTKRGDGTGRVQSNVGGLNCGGNCPTATVNIDKGATVALTASPDPGNIFQKWSGAVCQGSISPCSFTMNSNKSVDAWFQRNTLTVLPSSGYGGGTVTSINSSGAPDGFISCGGGSTVCTHDYNSGVIARLTAAAGTTSLFTGWTVEAGTCTGTTTPCDVTMTGPTSLQANFAPSGVGVILTGNGSGTVKSGETPTSLINCTNYATGIKNDCAEGYSTGASVTLTAIPATGTSESVLTGWSSPYAPFTPCIVDPLTGSCRITVNGANIVAANFTKVFALTAAKTGTGSGVVRSNESAAPYKIDCGTDCTEKYTDGSSVTLNAAPSTGSSFSGWTGACTNTTGPCPVSMTAAKTVTAIFALNRYNVNVTKSGTGSGSITGSPAGTICGANCTTYDYNTTVVLTPVANSDSIHTGWGGACAGTAVGTNCTLTMDGNKSVSATFTKFHFEETDPGITYFGTWSSTTCASCSGGSRKEVTATGAYASYTFTGSAIKGIFTKASNMGLAYVYVDGVYFTSIDLYSATTQYQQTRLLTVTPGTHTVRIEYSGVKNTYSSWYTINLDALEVTP